MEAKDFLLAERGEWAGVSGEEATVLLPLVPGGLGLEALREGRGGATGEGLEDVDFLPSAVKLVRLDFRARNALIGCAVENSGIVGEGGRLSLEWSARRGGGKDINFKSSGDRAIIHSSGEKGLFVNFGCGSVCSSDGETEWTSELSGILNLSFHNSSGGMMCLPSGNSVAHNSSGGMICLPRGNSVPPLTRPALNSGSGGISSP